MRTMFYLSRLGLAVPFLALSFRFGGMQLSAPSPSQVSQAQPSDSLLAQAKGLFSPLPDSPPSPAANPTTKEKVELGKMLYNDLRLSKSHQGLLQLP